MADNLNSINSNQENEHKWWLLERIRRIKQKTVIPAVASLSIWWAPVTPLALGTWATAVAVANTLLTSCSPEKPDNPIEAPEITPGQTIIDVSWWKNVYLDENNRRLTIGNTIAATRKGTDIKEVKLLLDWNPIKSWITLNNKWTLTLKVTNKAGKESKLDIILTVQEVENQLISWLENLENLVIQVDQEVNLLNWITLWEWVSWEKVEMKKDWQIKEIADPEHAVFDDPWACDIILTIKKNGELLPSIIVPKDIKPLEFKSMEINNLRRQDIIPVYWQVEIWDKNAYNHIEHIRIAECTVARDMMWKYWAGNYSPTEYQQLMGRLHTGMINERPKWYDNYETIWPITKAPSDHAHKERYTLNTLIDHAHFQMWQDEWIDDVINMVQSHPNNIYIFWCSVFWEFDKVTYNWKSSFLNKRKTLSRSPNVIAFVAGSNIRKISGILKNKILHENAPEEEHWDYALPSTTNGKNNQDPNNHLIVCIWTNSIWNVDQTNEIYESSKFPVGFHNNSLVAWRTLPAHSSLSWKIEAESWKYKTSNITYNDMSIADLCFQMRADVNNAGELLNMIRSSSGLTDHIKFGGEDQPLTLPNTAWFFKAFDMPNDLPSQINSWEIIPLKKWFYKLVIFDIPWAEACINWEWIPYNDANKSLIKAQNPSNTEWRRNWPLCRKMWYKWKTIQWKIIAVDDKRNGLSMDKSISTQVN